MVDTEIDQMKNNFNEEFKKLVSVKGLNSFYINNKQYEQLINDVVQAKKSTSLTKLQRRRLKRYAIYTTRGLQKLIVPPTKGGSSMVYYLKNEEMFDVLYKTHLFVKHGGKHRMLAELKKKYKNVTQEIVLLFLKLCLTCQSKQKSMKKDILFEPIVSTLLNSRCQVDLIDKQLDPDGPFKFIMVYQDHVTKFIQLRPLTCDAPTDVAKQLLDIFCIFGVPEILQSGNGHEFIYHTIEELQSMWKGLNIVLGSRQNSQLQENAQEGVRKDIENRLVTWMATENCNQWSVALKFIQFMINSHHDEIKGSPYKAMFGTEAKIVLSISSVLPKEPCKSIRTEDLAALLDGISQLPQNSKGEEIEDEELLSDIEAPDHLEIGTSIKDKNLNSDAILDETIKFANDQNDVVQNSIVDVQNNIVDVQNNIVDQNMIHFENNTNKRKRI